MQRAAHLLTTSDGLTRQRDDVPGRIEPQQLIAAGSVTPVTGSCRRRLGGSSSPPINASDATGAALARDELDGRSPAAVVAGLGPGAGSAHPCCEVAPERPRQPPVAVPGLTGGQVLSVDHALAGSGQGSETKRIAGRILGSPGGVGVGRRGFLSSQPGQVHRMIRDPSGGGFSLYGAPWWVGVIGVVAALVVIGLARLWWDARLSFLERRAVNQRRRGRERTRRNRS